MMLSDIHWFLKLSGRIRKKVLMIKINTISNNKSWKKYLKNPNSFIQNKISKLNKKFRNCNKPTDVLSFPFFSSNELKSIKQKKFYIGDIATSYEIINYRSKKDNFLLNFDKAWIHGLLHLVGYDHIRKQDYYKMNKIEKRVLNSI